MGTEFIPENLNLLGQRPVVSVINGSEIVEYSTLNSVENTNVIEFLSLPYGDRFKALDYIYLKMKLRILKNDLKEYLATDANQPSCVSNLLHSLIKSAYCSFNNVNVISIDDNYAQKEWLEAFLSYPLHSSRARLGTQHYFEGDDDAALMKETTSNSKIFEIYGRVNLFGFEKALLPSIQVAFRFNMQGLDFVLQENLTVGTGQAATTRKPSVLKLLEAKLYIKHFSVVPSFLVGLERAIASNQKVSYEFDRGIVISQSCPPGMGNLQYPHLYQGLKPKIAIFFMCTNANYLGNGRQSSPFTYKHFGLQTFNFILNGSSVPSNAYEIKDASKEKCYSQVYSKIYEAMNIHSSDKSIGLTMESFIKDRFMLAHDFTNSGSSLSDVLEPLEQISLGVAGSFEKPTTEALTLLIYLMIPTKIDVYSNRSVVVAY